MQTVEAPKQTKWIIDRSHSEISFKVRHMMISHTKGSFKIFDASIYTIGRDFSTANVDLWIDASSIETGDPKRDQHLKGPDFFNVQKHKEVAFTSDTIQKTGDEDQHEMWGELAMNGVSKKIKLNVKFGGVVNDPWGNEKAGFSVKGKIKRSDWGLNWNTDIDSGGLLVGDEVSIICEIELINSGQMDKAKELEHSDKNTLQEK